MKTKIILSCLILSLFVLFGCDKLKLLTPAPARKVSGTVIAEVDKVPVTLEQLNREIEIFNASVDKSEQWTPEEKAKLKIQDTEGKTRYLTDVIIPRLVLYQGALNRGLDRKEDIKKTLVDLENFIEERKIELLARAMREELTKNITVTPEELDETYKRIQEQLKGQKLEQRKISEIVTKTEGEANKIFVDLSQGADFAAQARQSSIASSKDKAGDLGFIRRGQRGEGFESFDDVAFSSALSKGKYSFVFKGPDGFYIVKVDEIKELALSDVEAELKNRLLDIKVGSELKKFLDKTSKSISIKTFPEEIK